MAPKAAYVTSAASAGGAFTPRLAERPQYPPFSAVAWKTIMSYTRTCVFSALLVVAFEPVYSAVVRYLEGAGLSDKQTWVLIMSVSHILVYSGTNGFFFACAKYGLFEEYRFERKPYQVPSRELFLRTLRDAFVSQVVLMPAILLWKGHAAFVYFGMPPVTAKVPS